MLFTKQKHTNVCMDNFKRRLDPLEDVQARIAIVKTWDKRLEKIKEKHGTFSTFCEKHNIKLPWLSKAKNLNPLPKWNSIRRVEEAFAEEGF